MPNSFPKWFLPIYTPTGSIWNILVRTCQTFNFLPVRWEYGIFVVLIHSFFITNKAEHLFMFIDNVNSLFGEVAVQIFHLILNCLTAFFFFYWFIGVILWSIYSGRGPELSIWVENIFHFVACLFTLFMVTSHDQKYLKFIKLFLSCLFNPSEMKFQMVQRRNSF